MYIHLGFGPPVATCTYANQHLSYFVFLGLFDVNVCATFYAMNESSQPKNIKKCYVYRNGFFYFHSGE